MALAFYRLVEIFAIAASFLHIAPYGRTLRTSALSSGTGSLRA
jgi:hypothetical protein